MASARGSLYAPLGMVAGSKESTCDASSPTTGPQVALISLADRCCGLPVDPGLYSASSSLWATLLPEELKKKKPAITFCCLKFFSDLPYPLELSLPLSWSHKTLEGLIFYFFHLSDLTSPNLHIHSMHWLRRTT